MPTNDQEPARLAFDVGNPTNAGATLSPAARYVRIDLDTIPDRLSLEDGDPVRYRYLGRVGWTAGDYRSPGESLHYAQQILEPIPAYADSLYWVLVTGVSGTIYRGRNVMDGPAIACKVYRTAALSPADNTDVWVDFDAQVRDDWGMHSLTVNPSRITVTTPGWYQVTGGLRWSHNATGYRMFGIWRNRTERIAEVVQVETATNVQPRDSATGLVYLDAGDYVEMAIYQNSGGALAVQIAGVWAPGLALVRVGG